MRWVVLIGLWLAATLSEAPAAERLYLERGTLAHGEPGQLASLLGREACRQLVWTVAAHDLGWRVGDETLFDQPVAGDEHWSVRVEIVHARQLTMTLQQRVGDELVARWSGQVRADRHYGNLLPPLFAGLLSHRAAIIDTLRAHSEIEPDATAIETTLTVPECARRLLDPSLLEHAWLIRELEAHLRSGREDARPLLARGYAQLGLLSERHWAAANRACKARGLLLAERDVIADPGSRAALETLAIVRSLAGLHAAALQDLADAAPRLAVTDRQGWRLVAEWNARFDVESLRALAESGAPAGRWAALLATIGATARGDDSRVMRLAELGRARAPDCMRLLEQQGSLGGIGNLNDTTATGLRVLAGQLGRLAERLPADVQALAADPVRAGRIEFARMGLFQAVASEVEERGLRLLLRLPDVRAALRAAPEQGGLSWDAFGGLVEEAAFARAVDRLVFLTERWGVDASDAARVALTVCRDHRYAPFLRTFLTDDRNTWHAHFDALELVDETYEMNPLRERLRQSGPEGVARDQQINAAAWWHIDPDQQGMRMMNDLSQPAQRRSYLAFLERVSPHDPMAAVHRIGCDWERTKDRAYAIAERHAQHPAVLRMLSEKLYQDGEINEAAELARRCLDISPESRSFRLLLHIHLKNGDVEPARKVLAEFLETPDPGLAHASLRQLLANHYLRAGHYREALPYVEANARTYASAYLQSAALCYDGLGDFERANAYWRANTERYESPAAEWLFWCVRTGHGEREQAEQATRRYLSTNAGVAGHELNLNFAGVTYSLLGDSERARHWLRKSMDEYQSPYAALQYAILAAQADDRPAAAKALAFAAEEGRQNTFYGGRPQLVALAEHARRMFDDGTPMPEDRILALADEGRIEERANVLYFAGMLYRVCGHRERGDRLLRTCATDAAHIKYTVTLARDILHRDGVELPHVEPHTYYKDWQSDY